jgi:hypothetical protein
VTIGVTDEGDGESASATTIGINVAADQAPVLTAHATAASFTAGGSPVTIDPGITVTDADNPTLSLATVTIGNYVSGEDTLDYEAVSGITVTNSGGAYTFTGTGASPSDFTTELDSLAYYDGSSDPTTTPRTLSIVVTDGQKNATANYTIDVSVATPPAISVRSRPHPASAGTLSTGHRSSSVP